MRRGWPRARARSPAMSQMPTLRAFAATDIEAFSATLDQTKLTMAMTQAGHVTDARAAAYRVDEIQGQSWETQHSGNSVSLEQEMIKAGEVKGAFSLNTAIVKSFHRMLLMSSKG